MNLSEVVDKRQTVRAFKDTPVDLELIGDLLYRAARAPSNGNLQPWRVYVSSGDSLAQIKTGATARIANEGFETPEYDVYAKPLPEPYHRLRFEVGEALYKTIGVAREDKPARHQQFARNAQLFGAPVGLFFYIDRRLGFGQWMDLGMYIQTVMLLLEEHGLSSCAQGYWTFLHQTVADVLHPPAELMLATGMAVGYADESAKINSLRSDREPLENFARFIG